MEYVEWTDGIMLNVKSDHHGVMVEDPGDISLIFPIFLFFLEDMADIPGHVFTRGMIVAALISVSIVCLVIMGVIYRVDLALFYRHFTGRDETLTGNRCRHAGASYFML